jgi:AcrR family transcriptional regulator
MSQIVLEAPLEEREAPGVRQRILAAAETLFFTHGFSRVTMDDLARELGMSKKTLYAHFAGKEDLFRAVADGFFDQARAELTAIMADDQVGFPERVRRFLTVAAGRARRLQVPALHDIKRTAPHLLTYLLERRRQTLAAHFGVLIQAGVAAGMIRADLHPGLVQRMALTIIEHVAVPETLLDLSLTPAEAFHTISSVLFEGMLTAEARAGGHVAPP